MYLNQRCHIAALGIQSMFLPTPYGGNSFEWVNSIDLLFKGVCNKYQDSDKHHIQLFSCSDPQNIILELEQLYHIYSLM